MRLHRRIVLYLGLTLLVGCSPAGTAKHFAVAVADALEDVILGLVVPEPGTAGLLAIGLAQLAVVRPRNVARAKPTRQCRSGR